MSSGPLAAAAAGGDPMSKFSVDGGDSGTGVDPGAGEVARAAMLERLREREANVMAAPALRLPQLFDWKSLTCHIHVTHLTERRWNQKPPLSPTLSPTRRDLNRLPRSSYDLLGLPRTS